MSKLKNLIMGMRKKNGPLDVSRTAHTIPGDMLPFVTLTPSDPICIITSVGKHYVIGTRLTAISLRYPP